MRCKKARQHAKGQKDIAIIAVSKNGRKETIDEKIFEGFWRNATWRKSL